MKTKSMFFIIILPAVVLVDVFGSLYFIAGKTPLEVLGLNPTVKTSLQKPWWQDIDFLSKISEPETVLIPGEVLNKNGYLVRIRKDTGEDLEVLMSRKARIYNYSSPKRSLENLDLIRTSSHVVANAVFENNKWVGVSIWVE